MGKGKKKRQSAGSPESGAPPAAAATRAATTAAASSSSASSSSTAAAAIDSVAAMTRLDLALAAGIAILALLAFWPATSFDFVNIDDPIYLQLVPQVREGLSARTVRWAFASEHLCNWHPLTTLSYLAESTLFGLQSAKPFHVTNIVLHALGGSLLFVALRVLSGATWRSAFVAAVFVLHPLRVESVAWISERKDVLSGVFAFATLIAYAFYVRRPGWARYLLVALLLGLGLMSKAMLVTLPFVLLLLDYWPLGRAASFARLVAEKLPLIAMSAVSSVVTFIIQRDCGAMTTTDITPLPARLANALISYVRYLWMTIWPTDLTVLYAQVEDLKAYPLNLWPLAALCLVAVSAAVIWQRRHRPYLLVGWCWFLGMMVPVIGIVQVGQQAMADRYTYLPLIGVYVAATWAVANLAAARRWPREVLGVAAAVVLVACWLVTHAQAQHWRNSETLFQQGLRVTPRNTTFRFYLGDYYTKQKRYDEAIRELRTTVELDPDFGEAWLNLGATLSAAGRPTEALEATERAARRFEQVRVKYPQHFARHHVQALQNLALLQMRGGDLVAARKSILQAIDIQPDNAELHTSLGVIERTGRDPAAAVAVLRRALELKADHVPAHMQLGIALIDQGEYAPAATHLARAVQGEPDVPEIRYYHAVALARLKRYDEAAGELAAVMRAAPADARPHFQLGLIANERGYIRESVGHFAKALELDPRSPARNNLAWILATAADAEVRDGAAAVRVAEPLLSEPRLQDNAPAVLDTLAAAYAEAGDFAKAVETATAAADGAARAKQPELEREIRARLKLYEQKQAFREAK